MWFQELTKESWVAKNAPQQNIIVSYGGCKAGFQGLTDCTVPDRNRHMTRGGRKIQRYSYECGEVITYKLSPEQMKQVLTGEKTVDDFIREGVND